MDTNINRNKELNIWEALIPVVALIAMLGYNVYIFGDDALSGSNQFILLMGAAVAAIVGFFNKVSFQKMIDEVAENIKSTAGAILILLMVGALAGTWLVSGIIPSMIYYGLQILSPGYIFTSYIDNMFCNLNCNWKFMDNFCNCWYCFNWNWWNIRFSFRNGCWSCNFWSLFWG